MFQFSFLEKKTVKEIHDVIFPPLDDSYSSYETIRAKTSFIPEIIDKVHDIILVVRQIKNELASTLTKYIHFIHPRCKKRCYYFEAIRGNSESNLLTLESVKLQISIITS